MLKNSISYLLILGLLLFAGCFFDSGVRRITGKYYVLWIDLLGNQTISKQLEHSQSSYEQLVPEYVFSVGHKFWFATTLVNFFTVAIHNK